MSSHLFPRYHVRPPAGYLNDPNGPVVIDGLVHLYYQYRPAVDPAAPVVWGHATSTDFAHWQHHRPALAPHPLRGDRDGCWSGNTVVDDAGRIRAFYSGRIAGEALQRTLSATSYDGGFSFDDPRQVVDDPAPGEEIASLRDPFVWRDGSRWQMVVGAGSTSGLASMRLYASDDLDTWTFVGLFAQMLRTKTERWDSGIMWECPQILHVPGGLAAVVGSWSADDGIMNALAFAVPDAPPGKVITPESVHLLDHGPNFYAASVLNDSPRGAIVWGWATEGRSLDWCREDGWAGMLTLPRRVALEADGRLSSSPLPAMAALRVEPAGRPAGAATAELGAQFEIEMTGGAGAWSLRLHFGSCEYLEIAVNHDAACVTINRQHASTDPRADGGSSTITNLDALRTPGGMMRGFVDGSILELFLPGSHVATMRFYPTTPPPWRLEVTGTDALPRVRVWDLEGSSQPAA